MTGRVLVELPAHAGAATWIRLGAEGLVEARICAGVVPANVSQWTAQAAPGTAATI